jgi:hypothetical protein
VGVKRFALVALLSGAAFAQVTSTGVILDDDGGGGTLLFTDLERAPLTAWITGYCSTNGRTVTSTETVVYAGTDPTLCGEVADITTITGRVIEATTSTFNAAWDASIPGDVIYVHTGTYDEIYGEGSWQPGVIMNTYKQGTASQPIALLEYPGDTATFQNDGDTHPPFYFGNGGANKAAYLIFGGISVIGDGSTFTAGGNTGFDNVIPETGANNIRIVGVYNNVTNCTANTMTGTISIGGDGWKLLGNTFDDCDTRDLYNNIHVIYIQGGADDVEVAYNNITNVHTGYTIQVHQDNVGDTGSGYLYTNIRIHHNLMHADNHSNMRGFLVGGNINSASTIFLESNRHEGVGWTDFGGAAIFRGVVDIQSDEFVDTWGGIYVSGGGGGTRTITADDLLLCPNAGDGVADIEYDNGASSSEMTETNRRACP